MDTKLNPKEDVIFMQLKLCETLHNNFELGCSDLPGDRRMPN